MESKMDLMKEKKIEDSNIHKRVIINIKPNEYFLYDREKCSNQIIGFFTDGILTCSCVIISVNEDDILFFSHIHEDSAIDTVIKERVIPKITKINIKIITIIYSLGTGPSKNIKKEKNIDKIIEIIDNIFKSEKIVMEHVQSIQCLKLIETKDEGENKYDKNKQLLQKMIDSYNSHLNENLAKRKFFKDYINNINNPIKIFNKGIFIEKNLTFNFDTQHMKYFRKKFDFLIL